VTRRHGQTGLGGVLGAEGTVRACRQDDARMILGDCRIDGGHHGRYIVGRATPVCARGRAG